eukprot:2064313-Amphidinium_carterae.1
MPAEQDANFRFLGQSCKRCPPSYEMGFNFSVKVATTEVLLAVSAMMVRAEPNAMLSKGKAFLPWQPCLESGRKTNGGTPCVAEAGTSCDCYESGGAFVLFALVALWYGQVLKVF